MFALHHLNYVEKSGEAATKRREEFRFGDFRSIRFGENRYI